jgi:hypothetical protein
MLDTPTLIETSFAEAIEIISTSPELPEQTRRHWITSLRQIAKAFDKPSAVIPARFSAVRAELLGLHEVPLGLTIKTLRNHKSNVKAALLWLERAKGVPKYGAPLTRAWEMVRTEVEDSLVRMRLSALMRFCSAKSIDPADVDEAVIDAFIDYRHRTGANANHAFRRLLARAWNSCVGTVRGWPARRLAEPAAKSRIEAPWESFPEGLRHDVDGYLQGLTNIRRSRTGQRIRPLKASTIRTRTAEIVAAARMAVKRGVPINSLDSLKALLAPVVVEKVLEAYWQKDGEVPKDFTINLACRFLAIAKETKCLDDAACDQLDDIRRSAEDHRRVGMTDKNAEFLRKALTPGVWGRVVNLPFQMMKSARADLSHSPVRAAVRAQIAVAIAILSVAPVRLENLTHIRLGFNLIKPDGPESNYWLVFPDYDVKNRVKLEYPLPAYLTRLIDEYVFDFRPTLLRGSNEDWLFPGQRGGAKGKISFSGQISDCIFRATGLRMTVHQFRHAAGALILKQRPGEYELVRRLLGHRNVQTTINSYIGLENIQASEIFTGIVMEQLDENLEAAE